MHDKDDFCECQMCKLKREGLSRQQIISAEKEMEKRWMIEYGFYVHYVLPDDSKCELVNIHTHGVEESFKHPDFQIVLNIDGKYANRLFHFFVSKIKAGKKFEPNTVYKEYFQNDMPLKFIKVRELDRDVLRLLIPDKNGILPGEPGCDAEFNKQILEVT